MSSKNADVVSRAREDLRRLAASIIDAYEMRVSAISGMMTQAYDLVRSYQQDVEDALPLLRDNMAKGRSLRRHDFDKITDDVIAGRTRREQHVLEHLNAFGAEEQEMITGLREIVAHGKASDLGNLRKIQEDILTRERSRERQVIGVLRNYEIEEHELRASLRWLLNKGEKATVAHLHSVVNAVTARWTAKERDIFEVVEQLEEARSRVRTRWQQVIDAST